MILEKIGSGKKAYLEGKICQGGRGEKNVLKETVKRGGKIQLEPFVSAWGGGWGSPLLRGFPEERGTARLLLQSRSGISLQTKNEEETTLQELLTKKKGSGETL